MEHVWIIDPETRECLEFHGGNSFLKQRETLHAAALSIELSEVFAEAE